LIFELPNADLIFNVVFFIVLISALLQGSSLPIAAKKLGLVLNAKAKESSTIEIVKVAKSKRELIEIELIEDSPAIGLSIGELVLPAQTIIAVVARGEATLIPKGSTRLEVGDHVFIITKLLDKQAVESCFYHDS
jgi:cell volume regulation protein A